MEIITASRPNESAPTSRARLLAEVDSSATIDRNASDQIIPFAVLADGTSSSRTSDVRLA